MHRTSRRKLAAVAAAVLVLNVGAATSLAPAAPPDAPAFAARSAETHRVSYGTEPDQFGILHLPAAPAPHPVVVLIHGGGWGQKHDLNGIEPLAESLVDQGVAVWNIEYRRVGGAGGWPTTLVDVGAAIDAVPGAVQAASGDRLDPTRVHLTGHSAGGQLAAWAAGRHTLPSGAPGADPVIVPRSATSMAGVLDMPLAATSGDRFVRNLLGGFPLERPDRYALASPMNHLPIDVPVTALHGTNDLVVLPIQATAYTAAATAAGDPATLHLLPGVDHMAFGNPKSGAWSTARDVILGYVDRLR